MRAQRSVINLEGQYFGMGIGVHLRNSDANAWKE